MEQILSEMHNACELAQISDIFNVTNHSLLVNTGRFYVAQH
jgi:hypothetical protein